MNAEVFSAMAPDAERNVRDILTHVFEYSETQSALVVFDCGCELAALLASAYRRALPRAKFVDFNTVNPAAVLAEFDLLKPGDLVVLIQSTSFRLDAFRIRIELFRRSLKVIEHPHLLNIEGHEQMLCYVESLAYDPRYFRATGHALKMRIDRARSGWVESGGAKLVFDSPFEPAKLNVGDYRGMKNSGGQFPIGEVFTEAQNLEAVNGKIRIFAFGDRKFRVDKPVKPITLTVEKGRVIRAEDSTPEFDTVLAAIRADEGEIWVRELGFGLNRAFTQERIVSDIGTYERMCGIHLSLGAKHAIYKKPQFAGKTTWHHLDVFAATESVFLDDEEVYREGAWVV
jgi:hypothetical protein